MNFSKNNTPTLKTELHIRNKHRSAYNFDQLCKTNPGLKQFLTKSKANIDTIDFSNPNAVKALNKSLLQHYYDIDYWDIPEGYLCPPIPGRADYIHYLADLLSNSNNNLIPNGASITALDIGVGANCIYPIIGHNTYGWNFIGSDIDATSIESANRIIVNNNTLNGKINIRFQPNKKDFFKNIINEKDKIDITMCNPPFHTSLKEAQKGTERKWKNLKIKKNTKSTLNFGGQGHELWYEGGEANFINQKIHQSALFSKQCFYFSTLVSKKESLPILYQSLKKLNVEKVETILMTTGNKVSRILAWSFLSSEEMKKWKAERW